MNGNDNFLELVYFGNTVKHYLFATGIFLGSIAGLFILQKMIIAKIRKLAEKTAWKHDDVIVSAIDQTLIPLLYVGAFYFSMISLTLSPKVSRYTTALCVLLLTLQVTRCALAIIIVLIDRIWLKNKAGKPSSASKSVISIIKIVVWGVATVFVLDNMGFNISAVVAGLGISGIAIAFAAQTILGDLFNYFVIFFDKPFEEGDFIIVDDYMGVIEKLGIKTTRIRSLGGEQIIFSNSNLTSSRIKNYKRMERRRVLFRLGVVYQTSLDTMKTLPPMLKKIIESIENTVFDRAHFQAFGDFSLNLEVVYYVLTNDYNIYMDIQQQINYRIMEEFKKAGVEFAYPSQTIFVNK